MGNSRMTRRGVIAAAVAISAVPAAALAASPESAPPLIRPMLLQRMARIRWLTDYGVRFDEEVHTPALEELSKAMDAVPHVEWVDRFDYFLSDGEPVKFSTANKYQVVAAQSERLDRGEIKNKPYAANLRKLARAAERREAKKRKIRERSGMAAIIERADRISRLETDAEWGFYAIPSLNIAELQTKLHFARERYAFEVRELFDLIMTDVDNLASGAVS